MSQRLQSRHSAVIRKIRITPGAEDVAALEQVERKLEDKGRGKKK